MKQISLNSLILQNFKGFSFKLEPGGKDTEVYGKNASGKTNLADAFSWLLFDKDSLGRADFEIKNLDAAGQEEHGLEHSVEAILQIETNNSIPQTVSLKKVYRELWTKKRGSAKAVFTGHTTDHFINGVPVQKKDYTAQITEIAGEEAIFKLLTSPTTFCTLLPWQKQRDILMEICGTILDSEVIDADPMHLAPLGPSLLNMSLDDYRSVVKAKRTEINKALERIPIRIDEVRLGMPELPAASKEDIEFNVKTLEQNLNDKKLRLQGIDTGGEIALHSKELAVINNDIQKLEQEYYNDAAKTLNKINAKIITIENTRRAQQLEKDELNRALAATRNKLEKYEAEIEDLRGRWTSNDALTFTFSQETVCPTCNRPLPEDQIEDARKKALEEFNLNKATRLKKIEEEGKTLTQVIESLKKTIKETNTRLGDLGTSEDTEYNELTEQRDIVKKLMGDYTDVPGREDLLLKKADLEEQIEKAKSATTFDKIRIENEIKTISTSLSEQKTDLDKFSRRTIGDKRIEELKDEEKKLAAEFERLEHELYMTDRFIQTKAKIQTNSINKKFELVRFKLFEILVNGGTEDCCVATMNGVPYDSGLNSAGRTQAGCDIIKALQRHYGVAPVIWIDNRESCTVIPEMDCQVISLYVSPEDETLRVEKAK